MTHVDEATVGTGVEGPDATSDPSPRYLNRELAWLDFNARVLAIAEDRTVPLLERVKFLAIFSGNLDEFFQVRVAALRNQLAAGLGKTSPDGLSPGETCSPRWSWNYAGAGSDAPSASRWPAPCRRSRESC